MAKGHGSLKMTHFDLCAEYIVSESHMSLFQINAFSFIQLTVQARDFF